MNEELKNRKYELGNSVVEPVVRLRAERSVATTKESKQMRHSEPYGATQRSLASHDSESPVKMVRLGDVATYINGYAFKPSDWKREGLPIIRIQNLTGNDYETNYCNSEIAEKYHIKNGDVLISWSGSLGVFEWKKSEALLNQHIFKVVFDKIKIDKKYFIFTVSNLLSTMENQTHGSTMRHITKTDFDKIPFPLPPLETQKQIAVRLDLCADTIAKHKKLLELHETLVKSQFVKMFGDPVTNPMGWEVKPMQEVAPAQQSKPSGEEKIWLLNLDMVESETGRIIDYLIVNEDKVGSSTYYFDEKNVLYSKLRPYLNKVVVPEKSGVCTSELVPLRPAKILNRYFLANLLRSKSFVSFINEKTEGSKMPRVSMKIFREFNCILPPLALQEKFASFVLQVEKSKSAVQKSLEKAETLYKALMQKYFG